LFIKSDSWAYGKEFRVITTEQPHKLPDIPQAVNGFVQLPGSVLKSIIVGCQMCPTDRNAIKMLILKSGQDIVLKEAIKTPNRFDLAIHELPLQ
jgi:hypothetical protein